MRHQSPLPPWTTVRKVDVYGSRIRTNGRYRPTSGRLEAPRCQRGARSDNPDNAAEVGAAQARNADPARTESGLQVPPAAFTSQQTGRAEHLDFSPNGATLVSAHEDGTIRLWLWHSGDEVVNWKHHRALQKRQKAKAAARRADRSAAGEEPR